MNQEIEAFLWHYVNYQQDDWIDWLTVAEFQYNNKRHTIIGRTPFKLNFGRHLWKGNLMVQMEFPKIEEFLTELQRSWEEAMKAMEIAKEAMKRQFDKKRWNLQDLKAGDNIWLKAKNIYLNWPSKKLDQKRYRPFKILKDIGQGVFWLELPEGWMIHNVFNEDLLIRCRKPYFTEQCIELASPPDIINKEEEYEVEEIKKHRKQG